MGSEMCIRDRYMDGECCGGIFRFPAVADVPYRKEEEVRILAEECCFAG